MAFLIPACAYAIVLCNPLELCSLELRQDTAHTNGKVTLAALSAVFCNVVLASHVQISRCSAIQRLRPAVKECSSKVTLHVCLFLLRFAI